MKLLEFASKYPDEASCIATLREIKEKGGMYVQNAVMYIGIGKMETRRMKTPSEEPAVNPRPKCS